MGMCGECARANREAQRNEKVEKAAFLWYFASLGISFHLVFSFN